jgi:hypothetical protein
MLVPVDNTNTALSIATFGLTGPKARPRDFQRTTELVCKFIVDTTQLLNRLSAHCDEKLQKVSRDLQRFEVQLRLLEYKLDSIDEEEGRAANAAEDRKAAREQRAADRDAARAEADEAKQAAREARAQGGGAAGGGGAVAAAGGPRLIGAPPGTAGGNAPPPMMQGGRYGPGNVPLPGQAGKGMPLPPGFQQGAPGAPGGAVVAVPPPPPMSRIVAQPPPMPQSAGLTARKHPKLKGYFEMLDVGVPVQAVKARMQADGMKPEWLDAPDIQSPLPAMNAQAMKTFFDSD